MQLRLASGPLFEPCLARLRQAGVQASVPSSLPVLFFGNISMASVATIGLNPSRQEYLSPSGAELEGDARRFETLRSLGLLDRTAIQEPHALTAIDRMSHYFDAGKPAYSWFQPLERVLKGLGASLSDGSAVHLDLVQEATDPVWSGLRSADPESARRLLQRDLNFLRWQLEAFPIQALLCTSRTVLDSVSSLCNATILKEGHTQRLRWSVGTGTIGGRQLVVAGWNIPLARPTGLTADGQVTFGALLRGVIEGLQPL